MKKPIEYTSKYRYYPTIPVEVVNAIIKEVQIEAYNETLDDAVENATTKYTFVSTGDYSGFNNRIVDKESILKLKK
jgi:hypothetical protein